MAHPKTGAPLKTATYNGVEECAAPRPLETDEISRVVADYKRAAANALAAGFDGVELHAAHGYLIDQFIQDGVNKRTDKYGGTIENRCRFLFEVVSALCEVMGTGRVGVRLSPTTIDKATGRQSAMYFAAGCSDPDEVYAHAVDGMNAYPLAYLLLTEPRWTGATVDLVYRVASLTLLAHRLSTKRIHLLPRCVFDQGVTMATSKQTRASPSRSRIRSIVIFITAR
jgi:2,4-dienoyl-CoA reductase-like NADH-dependent reductase (Old Yellow Enzyme family)|eukprot:COSAG06_NODE_29_length_31823_cov_17.447106_17_plen_226_part_00